MSDDDPSRLVMPPPRSFDILDYRLAFQPPARLTDVDSWHAHIPFAFFSVELLETDLFVEFGRTGAIPIALSSRP